MPRFEIDITEANARNIEEMMALCGASTKKEFFNYALTLLAWVIKQVQEGRIIASIDDTHRVCRELDLQPAFGQIKRKFDSDATVSSG